jgi:hypothetical protein
VSLEAAFPPDGDAWLAARGVGRIAMLRIAEPGAAAPVLRGLPGALSEGRIGAVRFVHGPRDAAARVFLADLVALLASHGMTTHHLLPERLAPAACVPEDFAGRSFAALAPGLAARIAP